MLPAPSRQTRHSRPTRLAARLTAVAALAGGGLLAASAAGAVNSVETDVMAWSAAVDASIEVDQTANCMPGATDAVAYRNNRLVVRTTQTNAQTETMVNNALNALYVTVGIDYVNTPSILRITFPTPPGFGAITPVISVPLNPRPGGQHHSIVTASRFIRDRFHRIASPDYVYNPSGPYTHYWPSGYPTAIAAPHASRATLVPASGLPIGTGVKIWVADTGVAPRGPGVLPNLSQLASGDDEQPNRVLNQNDPDFADYPAAVHELAIASSISITAPGVTIQGLRVNERSGLLTDVDAADRIAKAMRTTPAASFPVMLDLSFGTAVCDAVLGGAPLQPLGTEAVAEVVDKYDVSQPRGMLIVASAGNMQTTRPHYPAAFTNVVGVGALDGTKDADGVAWTAKAKTAPVADFSNSGAWVDAYVPGVALDVVHAKKLRFQELAPLVNGAALVQGTSFSAPIYSGYAAEWMSTNPGKVREASAALLAAGQTALAQCGTGRQVSGKAVMLGVFDARITDAAVGAGTPC